MFPLTMDLNLASLQAGYYAVIGSRTDEIWPQVLQINANGRLTDRGGRELSRHSYAVIQVLTLKRRGPEMMRSETWGELLQTCKDEVLGMTFRNEERRSEALQDWYANLRLVRTLARKDQSFLQREVDGVIAEAQVAVEQKLLPKTTHEAKGLESYPDEWQEVLGFSTPQELHRAVRDYQDALKLSESLMQQYMILER